MHFVFEELKDEISRCSLVEESLIMEIDYWMNQVSNIRTDDKNLI